MILTEQFGTNTCSVRAKYLGYITWDKNVMISISKRSKLSIRGVWYTALGYNDITNIIRLRKSVVHGHWDNLIRVEL